MLLAFCCWADDCSRGSVAAAVMLAWCACADPTPGLVNAVGWRVMGWHEPQLGPILWKDSAKDMD